MSSEALAWMARAPGVKPHWIGTLYGLCNSADEFGRGARPTQADLSWTARKDERAVREDLRGLEGAGLIRKGDQRMVAHLPPDKRPVVWDVAMELDRGPRPQPGRPGRPRKKPGGPEIPPDVEIPGVSPEPGGATDPGGSVDPPVFDLGKQALNGKRGDLGFRQNLRTEGEELPPLTPREEEEQPAPSGAPTPTPADLTADEVALLAEITAAAPRWSPASIRTVLVDAVIRERADRALVRLAFLLAADDLATRTPRRMLHDRCPFWAEAEAELYPRTPAAEPGTGTPELLGAVPWCGSPGCDSVTRMEVEPETGRPLPGRPRCPDCHPQSPARLP